MADLTAVGDATREGRMERLEPSALDQVLAGLLRHDPPARVVAIGDNGLFIPMPTSVPLRGHPVVQGASSALELVIQDDIVTVIETWEEVRAYGVAQGKMHPAAAPSVVVELHFVDARHTHGCYLGFVIGAPVGPATDARTDNPLRPRYGITHKNEVAVFTHVDDAILTMLGWQSEDLIGRRSLELIHPEDHSRAIANWMDLLGRPGASRRVRLRHRRADGGWTWLEITNHNLLNDPDHGCVLGESVDITDEMAATEALRAGEELLRRLNDALPVGVVQLDADGLLVYRNDRIRDILGHDLEPGADVPATVLAAHTEGDRFEQAVRKVLAGGDDVDLEVRFDADAAPPRQVHVSLRALRAGDLVTGAIACLNDITEAVQLREELAHRACYDALTGCLTRRALLERLDGMLGDGDPVTALFIDLDGFKPVNDRHGHAVGDALLRHVGASLLQHVGDSGVVGRLGGDEFLVVTGTPQDAQQAARAADEVARAIGTPMTTDDGTRLVARASVGVARSSDFADADSLVAAADALMYQVKTERRAVARDRPSDRPSD
jgi:diguanylate cyclase (GGDEF)-like protein/PAS domain S-box-containing protein